MQPAASAGAILRKLMAWGTFHGTIAPTTPIGRRSTIEVPPNIPARRSSKVSSFTISP